MQTMTRLNDGSVQTVSVTDEPLYDDQNIGTAANISLHFFTDTKASVTEARTNMTQSGILPGNYLSHKVTGIKAQLTDTVPLLLADVEKFLSKATYVYKRAGTTIKWGLLREIFKDPLLLTMAPAVTASTTLATASLPHLKSSVLALSIADIINNGDNFSFDVAYANTSGVGSFANTRLAIYFEGEATKTIVG